MWFFAEGENNGNKVDDDSNSDSDSSSELIFANIVTGCSKSNHTEYLSHGEDTWILLQQAHDRVKGRRSHYKAPHTGMMVPFEIRRTTGTDQGTPGGQQQQRDLYVTEDVEVGTQLWQPLHYHTFHSQHDYVKFLLELEDYHHLQCEVLSWTHPSYMENEMYVDVTLDEGTFIAEAVSTIEANIDVNCRAIRPIKAGEKIAMNDTEYSSLINANEVDWFNNIRDSAWKRTGLGQQERRHPTSSSLEGANNDDDGFHIIAPSMAVLSAMYFVMKMVRGRQIRTRRPSYSDANDTYFHCNNNKAKIA